MLCAVKLRPSFPLTGHNLPVVVDGRTDAEIGAENDAEGSREHEISRIRVVQGEQRQQEEVCVSVCALGHMCVSKIRTVTKQPDKLRTGPVLV
eukprot:scaffold28261_cov33-Tisochrysis_lutea.AAC.3